MADGTIMAFPSESQTEYAFQPSPGEDDEAGQAEARNQQIQSAFDSQRFQRGFITNIAKSIDQLRQRQTSKS
jgi:hypothetical protein